MASPTPVDSSPKLSARCLGSVGRGIASYPRAVLAIFFSLTVASVWVTLNYLELKTSQNELVSTEQDYHRIYLRFLEEFGEQEFLYVVIQVEDQPERAAEIAGAVATELDGLKTHVKEVYYRVPPEAFGTDFLLLPHYELEALRALVAGLTNNHDKLVKLAEINRVADLLRFFADSFAESETGQNQVFAEWGGRLLGIFLDSMHAAAQGETPEPLADQIQAALTKGSHPRERGYLFTENGALAFVRIMPQKDYKSLGPIREPLRQIRASIDRVRSQFPDAKLGLTGRPVLEADEMTTTDRDMRRATGLALLCVLALFTLSFRRLRRPLLAGLALVVSIAITFGVVTITIGHLTILSIVFAAMIVGLGIDFGIHFLARYQDALCETGEIDTAMVVTLRTCGAAILTGGITTAAAFFTAIFVHFKGLRELGFVAGTGVLICLVTMLVCLPALVVVSDKAVSKKRPLKPPSPIRVPGLAQVPRFCHVVLLVLGIPTLIGVFFFDGVSFNFNLLDLQAQDLESVQYERLFLQESDRSTWQSIYVVDSLEEADDVVEQLKVLRRAGIVGEIESLRDFVGKDQFDRISVVSKAAPLIERLAFSAPSSAIDRAELEIALAEMLDRLDTAQSQLARAGGGESGDAVVSLDRWIRDVEETQVLLAEQQDPVVQRLGGFQRSWFEELHALRARLVSILQPQPITPERLPKFIRQRFVSQEGRLVVYAYPQKDIWQEANMREFVEVTGAVRNDVTGLPRQVYESAQLMRDGFVRAALYSISIVFLLLILDFRSLFQAVLALVPLLIGLLWLFQVMPVFGLSFNLANFFALPVLIGCGVDGGVHMVHRFQETRSSAEVGRTTASAVFLSFLTTIAGFGSLSIAHHRGIAGLGKVMALGCVTVLIATVFLLPAVMEIWQRHSRPKDRPIKGSRQEQVGTHL